MSENKWSSGPWSPGCMVKENSCQCRYILSEAYFGSIAVVSKKNDLNDSPPEEEAIANAHLIAAAPTMAEVLAEVAQTLEFVLEELMTPGAAYEEVEADLNKVRAVLSRARGEAS